MIYIVSPPSLFRVQRGWIMGQSSSPIIWLRGQRYMRFRFILFSLVNPLKTDLLNDSVALIGRRY